MAVDSEPQRGSTPSSTHRAAVVHPFRKPLAIERAHGSELAPGQVRVFEL